MLWMMGRGVLMEEVIRDGMDNGWIVDNYPCMGLEKWSLCGSKFTTIDRFNPIFSTCTTGCGMF